MLALDLHDRAHRARLLNGDPPDMPDKFLPRGRIHRIAVRSVLQDANQLAFPRNLAAVGLDRLDEGVSPVADPAAEGPGVDFDRGVAARHPDGWTGCGVRPGTRGKDRALRRAGSGDCRDADPLYRAVRPIGQRPGLDGEAPALGRRQGEGLPLGHAAPGERYSETHSGVRCRRSPSSHPSGTSLEKTPGTKARAMETASNEGTGVFIRGFGRIGFPISRLSLSEIARREARPH